MSCNGSGIVMGLGMITEDCHCQNEYYTESEVVVGEKKARVDRRSKEYKAAVSQIMSDSGLSKEKAMKLFEEEFARL